MKKCVLVVFLLALTGCPRGCEDNSSPTSVSDIHGPVVSSVTQWQPNIGVHAFGAEAGTQQPYLLTLMQVGAVKSIRTGMDYSDGGAVFSRWFLQNGGEDVLSVFPNDYLRDPDLWDHFQNLVGGNPQVTYWEIGNEVEWFIGMRAQEYAPIFLGLVERASREYPDRVFIPSPISSTSEGLKFLHELFAYPGFLEWTNRANMPLNVFSYHYYGSHSSFLREVAKEVQKLPFTFEIWVTEAGLDDPNRQIKFVETEYPRAIAITRATRIYWYDFSDCTGFALVRGLAGCDAGRPVWFSPLYSVLGGGAP